MSKDRLISGTLMVLLIILAVINKWIFIFVHLALTMGALYEFFYLARKKEIPIYSYTGIMIGVAIPISTFLRFETTKGWELLFIVVVLLTVFLMQFMRKDNSKAISGISTTLFGVLYVSWLFSFLIKIRFLLPGAEGIKLLAFILLVTKMGDVGALCFGRLWGKRPLLPRVSPNKTIEGSIGGLIASAVTAACAVPLISQLLPFGFFHIVFMGTMLGAVGQLGDMSESLLKRDFKVKDSGRMLPSLGGVLDMIDSLLFSAPVYYFYISSFLQKL